MLKPPQRSTPRSRVVEGEDDDDDDRQVQERVHEDGVEPEAALDEAGPAIRRGADRGRRVARGGLRGDGGRGHRTLTSRVLRPRFTNHR